MIDAIAREALSILGTGQQVTPFSRRHPGFGLADAYEVAAVLCDRRRARGEHPIGRKLGFTNPAVWSGHGISRPIWSYMFDSTVHDLAAISEAFPLEGLPEPRVEPEIVLHLARAPEVGMSEDQLSGCIDWIAHGFEIVQSIFPAWNFAVADAVAAYGMHGALLLGDRHSISATSTQCRDPLSSFAVELVRDDGLTRSGHARNVLGGPLKALGFLVEELDRYPAMTPLAAGEIVTTGTLTEAMPIIAGQTWSTTLVGIDLCGLRLRLY